MGIDRREPVQLGESTQWIRIRAATRRNPLLLLVQQGPGLPMLNEAQRFERVLSLADDLTVVYWDQRGCGRSLRSANATRGLSIQTMVSDTERLLAMLCERFDTPAVLAGFSMGATLGALAAARRPDLVATLVTVAMDIDGAAAAKSAMSSPWRPPKPGRSAERFGSSRRSGHHPTSSPSSSRRARGGPSISAVCAAVTPPTRWSAASC